jgi:hypothetical protein
MHFFDLIKDVNKEESLSEKIFEEIRFFKDSISLQKLESVYRFRSKKVLYNHFEGVLCY